MRNAMFCNGGSQKTARNALSGECALQKTSRFAQPAKHLAPRTASARARRKRSAHRVSPGSGPSSSSSKNCTTRVFGRGGAQSASRNLTFQVRRDHQNIIAENSAKCSARQMWVAGTSSSAVNLHARTGSVWSLRAGQAARSATFSASGVRQT